MNTFFCASWVSKTRTLPRYRQVWAELDEEPADQEVTSEQGEQYSAQYVQLKKDMLGRTQRFAGLLAAYLFLTVSSEV